MSMEAVTFALKLAAVQSSSQQLGCNYWGGRYAPRAFAKTRNLL
jgi:hypothetical protein